MHWNKIWPILIPASVAVVGWIASHQLASWRDRVNKRREQRVSYLVDAYRTITKYFRNRDSSEAKGVKEEFEAVLSDIQFLGNAEQIEAAKKIAEKLASTNEANLDSLLVSIRNELRSDLGRKKMGSDLWWLTHKKK